MATRPWRTWLRRRDGGELLEWLVVSAVASVLVIRWTLSATGYPRLGGGGLHIAHMLWGGLLMLVALVLLLRFLDPRLNRAAAVVAGLGFGTFLDEIGKFVTADNDYLFRPAIALIYLILVALFLIARAASSQRTLTPTEALANALEAVSGDLDGPVDRRTRTATMRLLAQADPADPLVRTLRSWLADRPILHRDPSPVDRLEVSLEHAYSHASRGAAFERAIAGLMVLDVAATVLGTVTLVVAFHEGNGQAGLVSVVGQTGSALVGGLLVGRGLLSLRPSEHDPTSRIEAFRWFRRGVLVWILVTQVFAFYTSQLAAVAGLGAHVLTYAALTYLLLRERARAGEGDDDPDAPAQVPTAGASAR